MSEPQPMFLLGTKKHGSAYYENSISSIALTFETKSTKKGAGTQEILIQSYDSL